MRSSPFSTTSVSGRSIRRMHRGRNGLRANLAGPDGTKFRLVPNRSGARRFPPAVEKVAWLSRLSTMEYANFLEWLWRLDDAPCDVVDLANVTVSHRREHGPPRRPRLAISLTMLHHDIIASKKLWDLAAPLQASMREEVSRSLAAA